MPEQAVDRRRTYQRLLKGVIDSRDLETVVSVDEYVDDALTQLAWEEPTLLGWLSSDNKIEMLGRANKTAIMALIVQVLTGELDIPQTMLRIDAQTQRVALTTALRAVAKDRENGRPPAIG